MNDIKENHNLPMLEFSEQSSRELSIDEQEQVNYQIQDDLIEHLYSSAITGVFTGIFSNVGVFIYFYYYLHVGENYLIWWCVGFNSLLIFMLVMYYLYTNKMVEYEAKTWEFIFSFSIIGCSAFWSCLTFFMINEVINQYLLIGILVMVSSAYAVGTVGLFYLSIISITLILVPMIIWLFTRGAFPYYMLGVFAILYLSFLLGMNKTSTNWIIQSLRLKIENSLYTYQANHDFLTGLPNYRPLLHYINDAISYAQKHSNQFAVLCLSLNRLEMFNTSLGYQAGDLIIKTLARRLKIYLAGLSRTDKSKRTRILTLPRANTFIILVTPIDMETLKKEASSIFAVLNDPIEYEDKEARLTASVGICLYPQDGDSANKILNNVKATMYKAKLEGGNQIKFYDTKINAKDTFRLELENDLHKAITHKEFVVYYQPIMNVNTNRIIGSEALIRWNHPKYGILTPFDFIDMAEETRLIMPIGKLVLEQACDSLKVMHTIDPELKVSVNVSVRQLEDQNFVPMLVKVLKKKGISPKFIDLELTETSVLDHALIPTIREIINHGFTISIDDFGAGYSGMAYLMMFKVEKIKIDRSFVQNVPSDQDKSELVSAIISMTKDIGIKVLAEGVETEEQVGFFKARDCHLIQGYYYSKPVPGNEFFSLVKKYNFPDIIDNK